MAQSFDILGGQYLDMIEFLRASFTQRTTEMIPVTLTGSVKDKPKSVTIHIQSRDPYYLLQINDYKLVGGEESYANMPMLQTFSLTHIHGALSLTGRPNSYEDKKRLVALIFITSEAARFEPFARHIATLIKDGDGARVLDYATARYYMNDWKNMFEWTFGKGTTYFKPLTEANMHNWNYYDRLVVQKAGGNMRLPFAQTQASLRPKSLADLR